MKVTDRIPANDFQRLIAAIQQGSERELESAIRAIAKAVKRNPPTSRKPAKESKHA
jgi:hypothetical protein